MPTYITITTSDKTINVLFNDLSSNPDVNSQGATFKRSELIECWHNIDPIEHLKLILDTGQEWFLNLVGGNGIMPVTNIKVDDGPVIVPTTIEELHTEIKKLFI